MRMSCVGCSKPLLWWAFVEIVPRFASRRCVQSKGQRCRAWAAQLVFAQDAQTLFCWPPEYEHTNAPHLTSAAKFCFGQPLIVRTVPRSLSDSALNLLVHASDQAATRRHVFCFNHSNGSFLWGVCLIKEELLSLPLSFLPPLTSTAAAAEAPTDHRAAERVR